MKKTKQLFLFLTLLVTGFGWGQTIFNPGDLLIVGIAAKNVSSSNGLCDSNTNDRYDFVTFKDITPGTVITLTDNGWERANAGKWGTGEGVWNYTRNAGSATIPAGTIFSLYAGVIGTQTMNTNNGWSVAKTYSGSTSGDINLNTGADQLYLMQGGTWSNGSGSGNLDWTGGIILGAISTGNGWTAGNDTQHSKLHPQIKCGATQLSGSDFVVYSGTVTATTTSDWYNRINTSTNWSKPGSCSAYNTDVKSGTLPFTTGGGTITWVGGDSGDTQNWFNCANWNLQRVPNANDNVVIPNTIYETHINYNAAYASSFGSIAKCKDLTINANKVVLEGNINDKIEVYGDLVIDAGVLDMSEGAANPDGQLYLYGDWLNNDQTNFLEGKSTVHFVGAASQTVGTMGSPAPEKFYNVVINNNLNTTDFSGGIIADGKLTLSSGKTLTVVSNEYLNIYENIENNGTITVENNGSIVQHNPSAANTGNITYKRTATGIDGHDYVYYSSPVSGQDVSSIYNNIPAITQGPIYVWNPTVANTNGGQGNWEAGSGVMAAAKGYIVRGSNDDTMAATAINTQFVGVPSNGVIPFTVSRGSITAATTGTNGVAISNLDDNHNLLGNPYPSAINALAFLQANSGTLLGSVKLWKHGIAPAAGNANFYSNFGFNYSATDYLTINFTGATTPGASDIIKAGQAFFVTMVDGAAGTGTVNFNNTMRTNTGAALDNSGFFRNAQANNSNDKNRIWVSLINAQTNTSIANTMFGYVNGATYAYDNLYDTPTKEQEFNGLFSLINNDLYEIQGKGTFNNQDIVLIAYQVANAGNYTIAINAVDGLFTGNQDIFLKDNLLNVTHNLKQNPYHFASVNGVIKNRFEIVYQSTLSTENPVLTDNVLVYKNENIITVKASNEEIVTVKIYDITGRKLTELNNVYSSEVTYDASRYANQVLLVQVTTESSKVITKKVL